MVVRAARRHAVSMIREGRRQGLRIRHHLPAILPELWLQGLTKRHSLGRDHVHQGAALHAREHRFVDLLCEFFVVREDEPTARPPQGLVRGGGHDVRMREGRWVRPRSAQPGDVRNVRHQQCAALIGDCAEARKINDPRVRRIAHHDDLGPGLKTNAAGFIKVDPLKLRMSLVIVQRVVHWLEELARKIDLHSVRKVPAVLQQQARERVPWLQHRLHHRLVRLSPRVRLHIRELRPEQPLRTLLRDALNPIVVYTPLVVPRSRIPLGVLVRKARSHGRHHRRRNMVLARDEFNRGMLPRRLLPDQAADLRIGRGKGFKTRIDAG